MDNRQIGGQMKSYCKDLIGDWLDCIGYTKAMQEVVSRITNKPTILGRGIAARAAAELLS